MFDRRAAARIRNLKFADFPTFVEELATMVDAAVRNHEKNQEQSVSTTGEREAAFRGERSPQPTPASPVSSRPAPAARQTAQEPRQEVAPYDTDRAVTAPHQEPKGPANPLRSAFLDERRRALADPFASVRQQMRADVSPPPRARAGSSQPVPPDARTVPPPPVPTVPSTVDRHAPPAPPPASRPFSEPAPLPQSSVQIETSAPFLITGDDMTRRFRPSLPAIPSPDLTQPSSPALPAAPEFRKSAPPDIPRYTPETEPVPSGSGYDDWRPNSLLTRIEPTDNNAMIAVTGASGIAAASLGPSGKIIAGRGRVTIFDIDKDGALVARPEDAEVLDFAVGAGNDVGGSKVVYVVRVQGNWVVFFELCDTAP